MTTLSIPCLRSPSVKQCSALYCLTALRGSHSFLSELPQGPCVPYLGPSSVKFPVQPVYLGVPCLWAMCNLQACNILCLQAGLKVVLWVASLVSCAGGAHRAEQPGVFLL